MGLNSEFIFAAVISGRLKSEAGEMKPGQVLLLRHMAGTAARRQIFSAQELAQKFRELGRDDLAEALSDVVEQQRVKRFWGLLRPTNISIGTPVRPELESVREVYATHPAMIRVKRSVDEVEALPAAVATAFLDASRLGDTETMAALLNPAAFRDSAREERLQVDRRTIARTLIEQDWARQFAPQTLTATPDPMRFVFVAGSTPYHIHLATFDHCVFVDRIAPITADTFAP